MFSPKNRLALLVVCILGSAAVPPANAWAPTPLPLEVIRKYEQLGAEVGRFHDAVELHSPFLSPTNEYATPKHMLGFQFHQAPPGGLTSLPQVDIPFGLSLVGSWVTEQDLSELKHLKRLRFLDISQITPSDKHIAQIAQLNELEALNLPLTAITDTDMIELAKLRKLKRLYVPANSFTRVGYETLAKMKSLTSLNTGVTPMTAGDLAELAKLTNLRSLAINASRIDLKSLAPLGKLKKLERWRPQGVAISDEFLARAINLDLLRTLPVAKGKDDTSPRNNADIVELNFYGWPITDDSLPHLTQLENLNTLTLGRTMITDDGLAALAECTKVTTLHLGRTAITDKGLTKLDSMPQLVDLELRDTAITDEGLVILAKLPKLTALGISGCPITDESMPRIADLEGLTSLAISGTKITDDGIAHLAKANNLETIYPSANITDKSMPIFADLPRLKSLWLRNTPITDKGLDALRSSKSLESLDVEGTRATMSAILRLGTMTSLRRIDMASSRYNDDTLKALREANLLHRMAICRDETNGPPKSEEDVTTIYLARTAVSAEGLRQFAGMKNLREISFERSRVTDDVLKVLREMDMLHTLSLAYRHDWKRPANAKEVHTLDLSGTPITDKGLAHLTGLTNVSRIRVERTNVTATGIEALRAKLGPDVQIRVPRQGYSPPRRPFGRR